MARGPSEKEAPLLGQRRRGSLSKEEVLANWENVGYRERLRAFFKEAALANYTMPVGPLLLFTIVTGAIWFAAFWYLVRDASQELFSERNMRKFILYNVLHGVLGFGATSGPMGGKFKVLFANAALMFMTPGTLCSPLLPGVVGLVQRTPAKRSLLQVLLYAAYVAALVCAIVDPSIGRVTAANSLLAAATVGDFTIFLASRGEHYGYMMICMSFPDWIAGCQWVQLMLWLMVGCSKCGPWFKYVIQVLVKDAVWSPLLPKDASARIFNKDPQNDDWSPSLAARTLGHLGALLELVFPLCCALGPPGSTANTLGVSGMIAYHAFIWCTLPLGSVFEWQYYTIAMTYFLYRLHPTRLPTSPPLLVFLPLVLLVVPVVGQLRPTLVPFLMAYRQYAGNWRMADVLLRKSAKEKFDRIKTYEPIYWWETAPEELGGERALVAMGAPLSVVPQFRGLLSIKEVFYEKAGLHCDDFWETASMPFMNAVAGWNLGGGWEFSRECWRKAVVEICSLEPGDMYMAMAEPVGCCPPHTLAYRVMDMTKGPLEAEVFAVVPYAELEGPHPMEVHVKPERIQSGRSIRGTCLDTYYV